MKIAVIGDKNFVLSFRLGGVKKICEVSDLDYVEKFEEYFEHKEIGIIIMEEKYFKKLPARLKKKIEKTISPVIIPISGEEVGASDIANLIKRVLGVDLWGAEKAQSTSIPA